MTTERENEKLLTELLDECTQKLLKEFVKFMKGKVSNNTPYIVDRFTHVFPLVCFHSMNKSISKWLQDENQIDDYKNRMEKDLKRYLEEFRDNF